MEVVISLKIKFLFVFSVFLFNIFVFSSPWAIVLSGGGARGAYEVGALEAITNLNLNVKGVYGTSVGALNGAFFVQGSIDEMSRIWKELSFSNVVKMPSDFATDTPNLFDLTKSFINEKGFNVKPLQEMIKTYLNEKKVRESGIDFGLVTVDLSNFSPVEIYLSQMPKGSLMDYLMASSNYPLFQRWKIKGSTYIDGGFYNNAPVSMALKKGFKRILLVNLSDIPIFLPKIPKDVTLKVIIPSGQLGNAMDFDPKKETLWEKMGYLDTMKAFGKFVGRDYYIYPSNKNILIDKMLRMDKDGISKLAKILNVNVDGCQVDFAVYERILPKILEVVPSNSFSALNLSMLEIAAKYFRIDRIKDYTQTTLYNAITHAKTPPKNMWNVFGGGQRKIAEFVLKICELKTGD